MPFAHCPYSASVAAQLADPAAHLDTELASHLPVCEACRHAASAAVRGWPTDRAPSPSLAEWLGDEANRDTLLSPFQAALLAQGHAGHLELGPYLLLDKLGEGGMGEVFLARHKLLQRRDAVKTVRAEIAGSPDALRRFLREAETVAKLHHPNVVHVYTADRAGAGYYLAMEYVPGTDLGKFARANRPLPIPLACEFVRQAAEGLHHAFTHGVVHRDIKPGNLLLARKDEGGRRKDEMKTGDEPASSFNLHPSSFLVKVADFGLARAVDEGRSAGQVTGPGVVLGTTDYMAPEQAVDSRAADTRADVYALGATLFYLLTGEVPFRGGTALEKMIRHATAPIPSARSFRPDVPPALDAVVAKCLAKLPEDRYQTPAELAAALLPFTRAEEPPLAVAALDLPDPEPVEEETAPWSPQAPPRPPRQAPRPAAPKPKRNLLWLLTAGAVLVLAVAIVVQLLSGPPRDAAKTDPLKSDPNKTGTEKQPAEKNLPGKEQPKPVGVPGAVPVPKAVGAPPWVFAGACWSERKDTVRAVGFLQDGSVAAGRDGMKQNGSDAGYWEVWPKTGGGKPSRARRPAGTAEYEFPVYVHAGRALISDRFRRFDPLTFEPLPQLSADMTGQDRGTAEGVECITASGNGKFVIGGVTPEGGNARKMRLAVEWETESGKVRTAWIVKTTHDVKAIDADHTGATVTAGTFEGKVFTYTASGTGAREWTAPDSSKGAPDPVSAIAITPNGKTVYSAHAVDGSVHVWSVEKNQRETTLALGWQVYRLTVSPDERWLAAAGYAVTVWDLQATPPKAYELAEHWAGDLKTVAFSADGKRLAVGGWVRREKPDDGAGVVWLWDLKP